MVDTHHFSKVFFNGAHESILCDAFGTYYNDGDCRQFDLLYLYIASVWQYDCHVPCSLDTLCYNPKLYIFYRIS